MTSETTVDAVVGAVAEPWSRERFVRWLTRYDPLPFFSALCVLVGVWLIAGDLGEADWIAGKLGLILVTQLYEVSLIVGVVFLVRARRFRTAALLALLEGFFLFDAVFNTQVMPHLEAFAWWTSSAWTLAVVLKAEWLIHTLRLRFTDHFRAFLYGMAGLVAFMPQILDDATRGSAEVLFLVALTLACLLLGMALRGWQQPKTFTSEFLDSQGAGRTDERSAETSDEPVEAYRRRVQRCGLGLVALWSILFLAHAVSWIAVFDLAGSGYVIALPTLTVLLAARNRNHLRVAAIWWLVASAQITEGDAIDLVCFEWAITCIAGYLLVRRSFEMGAPEFATAGLLALGWCASFFIPPAFLPLVGSIAILGLGFLAIRRSEPLAACVVAYCIWNAAGELEISRFGWGVATVALGFLALATGVWLQLRLNGEQNASGTCTSASGP